MVISYNTLVLQARLAPRFMPKKISETIFLGF